LLGDDERGRERERENPSLFSHGKEGQRGKQGFSVEKAKQSRELEKEENAPENSGKSNRRKEREEREREKEFYSLQEKLAFSERASKLL